MINISPNRQRVIVYVVLAIVTLAVYRQVNQYDFLNYDDVVYITQNIHIQSGVTTDGLRWAFSTMYFGLWNPLVWISYMFDYQLHGLNAGGYHLTNLLLHILSTLLLFWLFCRMTGAIWKSAFVAALFALHPLHVESVAWIAERKDVLSAFFWMLTLCFYVYYTEKPVIKRYLLVLFSFALALMSKPMVVTLPVIMILLDYWPLDRLQSRKVVTSVPEVTPVTANIGKRKNKSKQEAVNKNISSPRVTKSSEPRIGGIIPLWQLREKLPFFILSAIVVIITLYNPNNSSSERYIYSFGVRIANVPVAFVTYLGKTLWPHDMAIFYPVATQLPAGQVIGASLLIIFITAAVIAVVKRLPYLFAGWLWFAITIAPVTGIIQIGPHLMADRYTYLPSIGIAIMLAWGIPFLIKSEQVRKKILFPAAIAVLAILSFLTWKQCSHWRNSISLFGHALQVTENNYLAHGNLGIALSAEGKLPEAIDNYSKASKVKPDYMMAYACRGDAYAGLGQYQNAIEDYNQAVRLEPERAETYNNRGIAYYKLGNYQQAIEDCNEAIRLKTDYADAFYNRGNAYNYLGQYQRAIRDYNEAIRLQPNDVKYYQNRGIAYLKQNETESGCRDVQKACALGNCKTLEEAKRGGFCR
jgi:protein O-mannosyl-transferase